MATKIVVVVLSMASVLAYPTNARSLIATKAKATADEQNEYFQHPLSPFFGGFGGLRGGIRPPIGLGAGIGGFSGGIGGAFGSGFGPFAGSGGDFGDNAGGNNPNDNIIDAGDLGDAAIKNGMHP